MQAIQLHHKLYKKYQNDKILWRVFQHTESWYDIYTERLCLEDDDQLNFFDVESRSKSDVNLQLQLGLYANPTSERNTDEETIEISD